MRYHDITENHQPRKIEKGRVSISLLRKVASNQRTIQKWRSRYSTSFFFSFFFLFFGPVFPLFSSFLFFSLLLFLYFSFTFLLLLFFLHQKLTSDNNVALYT